MKTKEELLLEQEQLKRYNELATYQGEDQAITSHEVWDSLKSEREKTPEKYFSKIPALDKMIDGFRPGDVVVVSGITKQGKTTFCQNITNSLANQDIKCLWFSYELMPLEFLSKFKPELPFFTMPKKLKGNSLKWLDERIGEHVAKHNTKVVFIDHLHFLIDMSFFGQKGNTSLIIGAIMRELKKIALEHKVCIIIVAHTTKIKFEEEPALDSIRDSSFISQEADTVLMIWRRTFNGEMTNRATLAVLANRRNGNCGKVNLIMHEGIFSEFTANYENQ
jgi:replicative DNA helicase